MRVVLLALVLVLIGAPALAQEKPDLEKLELEARALTAESEVYRLRYADTRARLLQVQRTIKDAKKAAQEPKQESKPVTPDGAE